jgi:hypothetical protein
MFFISFLLAAQAFSQIPSGLWQGQGIYEAWGVGRFESQASIEIQFQDSALMIKDCWKFVRNDQKWNLCYDHSFEVIGSEIFVNQTKVGSLRENEMEIIYKRDDGQIHAVLHWDQNNILSGFHNAVDRSGRYTNKSSERLEPQN